MKLAFKLNIFFILFYSSLFAQFNVKLNEISEHKINEKQIIYKITAQSKDLNYKNMKNSLIFLNKEEIASNNIFYTNGIFETKDLNIVFKKGYFLQGHFFMLETSGFYKENEFRSKKTIFKFDKLEFEDVFIKIDKRQYKKLNHIIYLKN